MVGKGKSWLETISSSASHLLTIVNDIIMVQVGSIGLSTHTRMCMRILRGVLGDTAAGCRWAQMREMRRIHMETHKLQGRPVLVCTCRRCAPGPSTCGRSWWMWGVCWTRWVLGNHISWFGCGLGGAGTSVCMGLPHPGSEGCCGEVRCKDPTATAACAARGMLHLMPDALRLPPCRCCAR